MRSFSLYIALFLSALLSFPASGQTRALYTVALRGIPLNEALAEFSTMTGAGISYDPLLIEYEQAYCVVEESTEKEVLACILAESGLDYIQLSSGTYVVVESKEQEAIHGSIAGVVRDLETGQPLPNAHVLLASASIELGAVTNSNGQFTLPPLLPGAYLVNTTYLGYHDHLDTLVVHSGGHTFGRIELQEEPIVFTPLVIDGIQRRRPTESLDVSVLMQDGILEAGNYFQREAVSQQIASVPGVHVNDITADAHLQGSDAGEHQFLLDGVPIFLPQSAIGLIGPFSPFSIESVTVHQAGFGAEEGSHLAGVISARHQLESNRKVEFQIDPMSVNTRLAGSRSLSGGRVIRGMIALRNSIWRYYQQPEFQSTLDTWSKPDPFLIFGPSRQYTDIDPTFFQDILNVSSIPNTDLSFQDIHAAGEYEINAFSAIQTSVYRGSNKFGGTLIPKTFIGRQNVEDFVNQPTTSSPEIFPAPLSLVDEYRWQNLAGQVNYHTLIDDHTLFNFKARASTYDLEQNYRVIDSLEQYIDQLDFPIDTTDPTSDIGFNIPSIELKDLNEIGEYGLELRLERASLRHLVSLGIEGVLTNTRFDLLLPSLSPIAQTQAFDNDSTVSSVDRERVNYSANTGRISGFAQDRIRLSKGTSAEVGVRVSYVPARKTVYAEPRVALRFDHSFVSGGSIALKTAAGLYRQYLLQFDISTLNAGALFPSKRVWLPIDGRIRPPLAYHLSQSILFNPSAQWAIRASAYLKLYRRAWTINYLFRPEPSDRIALEYAVSANSSEFQSPSRGSTTGASFSISRKGKRLFTSTSYDFSAIERRSQDLFANVTTSVPWEEPHRMTLSVQWHPSSHFLASAQFKGVWGRSWGFRKAYYDFFGHLEETRFQPPFDFGNPEEHVLPPLYQLDLSVAYSQPIRKSMLQIRLDLLNALDHDNVVDWRLIWKDGQLVKEDRLLYPRIPSVALRVQL